MLTNFNKNNTLSSSLGDKRVNNKGIVQKIFMYIVLLFAFLVIGFNQSEKS